MTKKTKKITRKGCRNVQLVWHESEFEDCDGEWLVEKIHPNKPATYITKRIVFVEDMWGSRKQAFKKITKFPYLNLPNR
jgi:hypothetical protein